MAQDADPNEVVAGRILYLQFTNPAAYPPLEHSSRMLASAGWKVRFFGIQVADVEQLRFPSHPNIVVRLWPRARPGWTQKLYYGAYVLWAMALTVWWRPACVYVSDVLACPAGLLLSLLPGVRVIYHEHDSPVAADGSAFMRWCLWARRHLAHRARLCVVPSVRRMAQFAREVGMGTRVRCVWNCPRTDEVPPLAPKGLDGRLALLYHGSVVPSRLPLTVIQALAMLPETVTLRIIGYVTAGYRDYIQQLQEAARALRVDHRIQYLGPLPRSDVFARSEGCDVGIALMPMRSNDMNLQAMVGASNKPFDYLACGLTILMSDLPDWRSTYVAPGYGLACNPEDPASIAAELRWFLNHPAERVAMAQRGRSRILSDWNYERQFAPVLEILRGSHEPAEL